MTSDSVFFISSILLSLLAACFYSELTAMVYAGLSLGNFFACQLGNKSSALWCENMCFKCAHV